MTTLSGQALSEASVLNALHSVFDPELPISIVDLGLIESVSTTANTVTVQLVTTMNSCPGRTQIRQDVQQVIQDMAKRQGLVVDVVVDYLPAARWHSGRLTDDGRRALREVGVGWKKNCPHCGSADVILESPFGSSVCNVRFYCQSCRTPFEGLKAARKLLPTVVDWGTSTS